MRVRTHRQADHTVHFALEDKESACPVCGALGITPCSVVETDPLRAAAGYRKALPLNTVHLERVHALGLY